MLKISRTYHTANETVQRRIGRFQEVFNMVNEMKFPLFRYKYKIQTLTTYNRRQDER